MLFLFIKDQHATVYIILPQLASECLRNNLAPVIIISYKQITPSPFPHVTKKPEGLSLGETLTVRKC